VKALAYLYVAGWIAGLAWILWAILVVLGAVEPNGTLPAWPIIVAVLTMLGAKLALRKLHKKGEANG